MANSPNTSIPLTASFTEKSISSVRHQIERKVSDQPYFANKLTVRDTVTDYDHYPYTRWFRGVYYYPEPIVAEREAGWRPRHDDCYKVIGPVVPDDDPGTCFEIPCTTTLPCFTDMNSSYSDGARLANAINKQCIVSYR